MPIGGIALSSKPRGRWVLRLQQRGGVPRRRRISTTVCFERRRGPVRAVEGAVRRVNHWLKRNEQQSQEKEISPEDIVTVVQPKQPKVLLRIRTRCSTKLLESAAPGANLKSYLSLPISEYSLLDPRWIQLSPNKEGSTFRVTIPVNELLGIDMGPVLADIRVRQDHHKSNVTMFVEGVTFGKPELDRLLSVRLRMFLFMPSGRRNWMPFRRRRGSPEIDSFLDDVQDLRKIKLAGVPLDHLDTDPPVTEGISDDDSLSLLSDTSIQTSEDPEQESETVDKEGDQTGDGSKESTEQHWVDLNCAVQLRLKVSIPPVLAFVPKIIMGSAGRIILRHMVNGVLPNLLDLIVKDYHAWANGEPRGVESERGLFKFNDSGEDDFNKGFIENN